MIFTENHEICPPQANTPRLELLETIYVQGCKLFAIVLKHFVRPDGGRKLQTIKIKEM